MGTKKSLEEFGEFQIGGKVIHSVICGWTGVTG
jgi:hypothetical protein